MSSFDAEAFRAKILADDIALVEKSHETKCKVTRVVYDNDGAYKASYWGAKVGDWVSIRPCADNPENKSYLGVYIGEIALSLYGKYLPANLPEAKAYPDYKDKDADAPVFQEPHVLVVSQAMYNPAIFIPDLKKVVFGAESWWGRIESPDQLKQITDETISGTWYVQALKSLSEEPVEKDQ